MTSYQLLSLIFAGFTALGIFVAILQMRDTRRWNKMSTAISYLPAPHELNAMEQALNDSFLQLIDRTGPLTDRELEQLFSTQGKAIRIMLKNYLNMLESYCAAINHDIIDSEVAKSIYRFKFDRHFIELKPYIDRIRGGPSASFMDEMEYVLQVWKGKKPKKKKY